MAWNKDTVAPQGEKAVSVKEGNIDFFVFTEKPTKVRFLTEDITVEDIMSEKSVPREQALEILRTEVSRKKWIEPVSYWEHSVPSIPGTRFYSTVPCVGNRAGCTLCAENQSKKDAGISENKLLPFPIRKRYVVPAYFYEHDKILFVRGNEDFFDDISKYINKNGSNITFDIWKTGKGFETKYKSTFNGPAEPTNPELVAIGPADMDFYLEPKEIQSRIGIKKALDGQGAQAGSGYGSGGTSQAPAKDSNDPGEFVIPFGSYKGKTLKEIRDTGDEKYLQFLVDNGSGMVKEKAMEFLKK